MARSNLLEVDRIKFKFIPDNELVTNICANIFFGKNCANTKTHSFANYAIRIFDEGNNNSFGVLL